MSIVVETNNLSKKFGDKYSVNNVDIKVPEGSVYGFLGPNGAGKSTTMKMILGLVKATNGEVSVFGKKLNDNNRLEILKHTGSLIESPSYYGHLSGRENLEIVQMLKGVPKEEIDEVLHIVRMENQQDKKAGHYSLGMKQRLGLAAALLGKPKLLLLDEPTNGLDPSGILEMRNLICSLPKQFGMTVLVSSHLLSEIEQMATHVGIIDKGELIFQDSLESLYEHSHKRIQISTMNNRAAIQILEKNHIPCNLSENVISMPDMEHEKTAFLITCLTSEGVGVYRIEEHQKSLEEIFLSLTGKQVSL
jgi:ABC-type multidrug transport system, ATPase component